MKIFLKLLIVLLLLWASIGAASAQFTPFVFGYKASCSGGTLAIDSQEGSNAAHDSASSPLTWTFTNTAGNLMVIAVGSSAAAITGTTVTFDGTSLSTGPSYVSWDGFGSSIYWYYLHSPATGSHTVSVGWSGGSPVNVFGAAITFDNASAAAQLTNSNTAANTTGSSTLATVNLTGTASGDYVLGAMQTGTLIGSAVSPTVTSALLNVNGDNTSNNFVLGEQATSGGTATTGWDVTADQWGMSAVEVKSSAGGGCATPSATSYTVNAPTTGTVGSPTTAFTVTSNGALASAVTITPNDNGAGGSFSPSTITLAVGNFTSGTFVYTPAVAGIISISETNSDSLINPSAQSLDVSSGSGSVPPVSINGYWFWPFSTPTIATIQSSAPATNYLSLAGACGSGGGGGSCNDSSLTGGGAYSSLSQAQADITAWTNSGRTALCMVGGGGDTTVIATSTDATNFVSAIEGIVSSLGCQGVDFDIENGEPPASGDGVSGSESGYTAVASAITQLKAHYGSSFVIALSPRPYELRPVSGDQGFWRDVILTTGISNIDLVQPQDYALAGDSLADQQTYMTSDMSDWTTGATGLTIPASKIVIGSAAVNCGATEALTTALQTLTYYGTATGIYPTLRGGINWTDQCDTGFAYSSGSPF